MQIGGQRMWRRQIASLGLFTAMVSCQHPYALRLDAVDETHKEQKAVIQISDPQVYSRETLINDRRQEIEYLKRLLDESENKTDFEPQIVRDLRVIQTVKGQVSLGERQPVNQVDGPHTIKAGQAKARGESDGSKHTEGDRGGQENDYTNLHESKVKVSPQELFRDRQAYRSELRAAIASVNLDDLHDYGGNALYRLQFHATVFPGQYKNKLGIARFTLQPPNLTDKDVKRIYLAWLEYMTGVLNHELDEVDGGSQPVDKAPSDLAGLVTGSGLFTVVEFPVPKQSSQGQRLAQKVSPPETERPPLGTVTSEIDPRPQAAVPVGKPPCEASTDPCTIVKIAVPLRYYNAFEVIAKISKLHSELKLYRMADFASTKSKGVSDSSGGKTPTCEEILSNDQRVYDLFRASKNATDVASVLNASLQGLLRRSRPGFDVRRSDPVKEVLQQIQKATIHAYGYLAQLAIGVPECGGRDIADLDIVPPGFSEALRFENRAVGKPFAYTTAPMEVAQRISTVSRTVGSLEMALALTAVLPSNGMAGKADLATLREAAAGVETKERAPLVVGFSDRKSGDESRDAQPQFGWVFGPKVVIDPSDNEFKLRQVLSTYEVSADVSVPGWWPRIRLAVESLWVQNWFDTDKVLPPVSERIIEVDLPLNPNDLENLTDVLITKTAGPWRRPPQSAYINYVEPEGISACSDKVTILVFGRNLWRNTEVLWRGVKAESVTILPSMDGVAATFDVGSLFKTENVDQTDLNFEYSLLTVNTRNGPAGWWLRLYGSRTETGAKGRKCKARPAFLQTYQQPEIITMSPRHISTCSPRARIVMNGWELGVHDPPEENAKVFLGDKEGKVTYIFPNILQAEFDGPFNTADSESMMPLTVATKSGMVTERVKAVKCQ
jgi:hypothetical protein